MSMVKTIQERVKAHGAAQSVYAETIGVTQPAISRRLGGTVPWRLKELRSLAAIGVELDDVIEDIEAEEIARIKGHAETDAEPAGAR